MKNYLIILQVWFMYLKKQELMIIQANSLMEAEGIAAREVEKIQDWECNNTHYIVLECSPSGKPFEPKEEPQYSFRERWRLRLNKWFRKNNKGDE